MLICLHVGFVVCVFVLCDCLFCFVCMHGLVGLFVCELCCVGLFGLFVCCCLRACLFV